MIIYNKKPYIDDTWEMLLEALEELSESLKENRKGKENNAYQGS